MIESKGSPPTDHHHPRWRQFIHPNGKRIHVAASPEEHEQLKHQLTNSDIDYEFDLCIRGSPEHVWNLFTMKKNLY